ncbi:MAG: hypothetical protein ACERKD_19235 [Prolixibacteraceae bacterium]
MDLELLKTCLLEIEKKVNFGPRETWTNNEFQKLSEQIFTQTGIQISTSTIRRLFDKREELVNNPQKETKNALAIFLGYQNWADYQTKKMNKGTSRAPKNLSKLRSILLYSLGAISIIGLLLFMLLHPFTKPNYSDILFEGSLLVSNEVPHTVIVHYNLGKHHQPFYINWNDIPLDGSLTSEPTKLEKQKGIATYTYFNKRSYNIILLNDKGDSIKLLNSNIRTQGWECYLMQENQLIAIDSLNFKQGNNLDATHYISTIGRIDPEQDYRLFYRNLGQFNVDGSNFHLTFNVTPQFSKKIIQCHHFQVEISGLKNLLILTAMQEGCENKNNVLIGSDSFLGNEMDLSQLAIKNNEITAFEIKIKNKHLSISKNGNLVFESKLKLELGELDGIRFEFKGNGQIENPLLKQL